MIDEKTVRIKHVSELPDWFQLSKYNSAKNLDAAGWYEQLLVRYHLRQSFNRLQDCIPTREYADEVDIDIVDFAFEKIQKNPIISIANDPILSDLLTEDLIGKSLGELKQKKPHYSLGIHNITVDELLDIEDAAGEPLKQTQQQIKDYIDEFNAPEAPGDEPLDATRQDLKNAIREHHKEMSPPGLWLDHPLHKLANQSILHEAVRINWELPDSILIEHFKQFLKSCRPESKSFLKSGYRKPDFNEWYRLGILPYFDLNLWALEEEMIIPNRVMADAIYPLGESGEETVRKTTIPLINKLLSEVAIEALACQSALAIAEQNNS